MNNLSIELQINAILAIEKGYRPGKPRPAHDFIDDCGRDLLKEGLMSLSTDGTIPDSFGAQAIYRFASVVAL